MTIHTFDLYDYCGRTRVGEEQGILTAYLHSEIPEMHQRHSRPAILVIPGGGYQSVSDREGEPIAIEFFHRGYNAYVLKYSVAPAFCFPTCLIEAGMAMLFIRDHAAEHGSNRNRVAAVGFSAGGHLAGLISLCNDDPALQKEFGARCGEIRPDATIYSYAVVSAERFGHPESFRNLCADVVKAETYSLEKRVTGQASPAFIWATMEDSIVSAYNSLALAAAYKQAGVSCELHLFEYGQHGLSTCRYDVSCEPFDRAGFAIAAQWLPMCYDFLEDKGFKPVKL